MNPPEAGKKILIADDEPEIVSLLKDRLEFEGYRIFTAYEGVRAIEVANKEHPDLIILDLRMPAGDGRRVLKSLRSREETRKIPIIVLTALVAPELEQEVRTAGADDFMRKPCDLALLSGKIASLLKGKVI